MRTTNLSIYWIVTCLGFTLLFNGCQWSGQRQRNTPAESEKVETKQVNIQPTDTSATEDNGYTGEVSGEEFIEFYESLNEYSLPLLWDDEDFDELSREVPARIYRSFSIGFDYDPDEITAGRLPEKNGVKAIIVTTSSMVVDYLSRYLFTFSGEYMENIHMTTFYEVREIDGHNTLITHAEIDEDWIVEIKTVYFGYVEGGETDRIVFRHEYLTPEADGSLQNVFDVPYRTITYTEEMKREEDGEYYCTYNFTVTKSEKAPTEDGDWGITEWEETLYTINDNGWLVKVESF